MNKRRSIFAVAIIAISAAFPVHSDHLNPQLAKGSDPSDPRFASFVYEVVSIKPDKGDSVSSPMSLISKETPDGYFLAHMPLRLLILQAYVTQNMQVAGVPRWLDTERYDIEAKMSPDVMDALQKLDPADKRLARNHMLQELARVYLKLSVHKEPKEVPGYNLVVGKKGPSLHIADPQEPERGLTFTENGSTRTVTAHAAHLSSVLGTFSGEIGGPVFDKTGLVGKYDFVLKYAPERYRTAVPSGSEPDAVPSTNTAPPLANAIEEQLGLKLVSAKGMIDVLIIDHVERPTTN